jgi:hypothetical protein
MSCLGAPQKGILVEWVRPNKRNPGRMGTSQPRNKRDFLLSAASLPDLIGSNPMRSSNEPGSLRAWSDKWQDKFHLWQFSQWAWSVHAVCMAQGEGGNDRVIKTWLFNPTESGQQPISHQQKAQNAIASMTPASLVTVVQVCRLSYNSFPQKGGNVDNMLFKQMNMLLIISNSCWLHSRYSWLEVLYDSRLSY